MKKIPYSRQWVDQKDINAVVKVLQSDFLTQGLMVDKFEKVVADYCGAKYAVAVSSGTAALHIACLAADIKKGDEGITSPITFAATSNAMLYCGAKPIFADIVEDTICIDPKEIEKKISKRTKVIIPVHFAGQPCDMREIYLMAKKKNITVIEDAAHALGAEYMDEKIGSCKYSDMTILSFHAVKHITTGEGGMVLTNDIKLYEKLKVLRTHGISRDPKFWYYEMNALGFNYRLTNIQCALGISQLKKLPRFCKKRINLAKKYDAIFKGSKFIMPLKTVPYVKNSFHLYVVRFKVEKLNVTRQRIFDEYRGRGILVNVHYLPVYWHPYYRKLGYKKGLCPRAEKYYAETLTLPLYPRIRDCDFSRIIRETKRILKKYA